MTLSKAILELSTLKFNLGLTYVTISRVYAIMNLMFDYLVLLLI